MGFGNWKQWRFVTMASSYLDGRTQLQHYRIQYILYQLE